MTLDEIRQNKNIIIDDMSKYGRWAIGNFKPSILKTEEFELGIFQIKKGEKGDGHWHTAIELNFIIEGECVVVSEGIKHKLKTGQIFIYPPKVKSNVSYTKDTTLIVIKVPSLQNDKFYDGPKEEDEG